ncbi:uncharacterized protein N7459_000388 [Penicillium hispanicum]|uniref:uncharacterized protein n=1 Tax=Penicillium hispanicum TaxID=1080232 RepID=UPI002542279A|nr:uncharacterized protein N7459_000388 [Penicillium hispanicum]KAJ5594180.1 hypothetical protein N7459_000388 [Penicillium hispanicum]
MMRGIFSIVGGVIFTVCLAQLVLALQTSYQLVEELKDVPPGWSKEGKPSPSTLMTFQLAVAQPTIMAFEQTVIDLSTPDHPSYGQHMKREQVDAFLRPQAAISNQIMFWLKAENVSPASISVDGNWITFKVAVSQAERMLKTQFFYFHNHDRNATAIRTLKYSVPRGIYPHVQLIQPTTRFGHFSSQRSLPLEEPIVATLEDLAADCGAVVRPECLRDMYGLGNALARPDPRNRLGISGFLDQYARHHDFQDFLIQFAPNETDANFTVVAINGGLNDQNSAKSSAEASLDIQYSISLAYNPLATYYTTGGRGPLVPDGDQPNPNISTNEPYLEQLRYLIELPDEDLPAVLTTSYGESEQSVPTSYATAVCSLFAQLGARGVSVIFSSGDSGPGGSCQKNDGTNQTAFLPGFPASCPFVTSVGGTYRSNPERAINFSGGGFSEVFPRPAYQDQAVQGYFQRLGSQWKGLYNAQGRGIPDVAAQSSSFVIRDHGVFLKIGGTSASAPVFAGIVSQLNAVRLAQGKPRMGFLNPWLYAVGWSGFTDIVNGSSQGCYRSRIPNAGWNATEGWDPATGLGTPFFPKLASL